MDKLGVTDKYQMELIKMCKRMINSLKYTQSSICFAYAKAVRSQYYDKTYIGSLKKGFSFLGNKILGGTLRVSTTSLQQLRVNINRLYEQQASNARLGRYLEKWLRFAKGGVKNLISPINFNINPNPSTRMRSHVSDDVCHVSW